MTDEALGVEDSKSILVSIANRDVVADADVRADMVAYADDDSDDSDGDDYCDVIAVEAGQQQPLSLQLAEVASRPLV